MTQLINATVRYPAGKSFPSQYGGNRQNIVVTLDNGQDEKIYFDEGREPHCSLQRGQKIQILLEQRNGKTYKKLVEPPTTENANIPAQTQSQQQPTPTPTHQPLTPQQKREIAAYVQEQAKLFNYCLDQAIEIGRAYDMEPSDTRAIATTLHIAAQRKFNL